MAQRSSTAISATAFHEAGHAVQAHLEGLAVRWATIIASDGADGTVRLMRPLSITGTITITQAARHARVSLAGWIAQKRHAPRSIRKHQMGGDYAAAARLAMAISGSERQVDAWVHLWTVQVEEVLAGRWPAVNPWPARS